MNLSKNIFFHRTRCHLSQGDLANELEVSRQSISKWENNSAVPELDKLIKMSALFGITLDELVFGDPENPPAQKDPEPQAITGLPEHLPIKIIIGLILFVFGLLGFLLSVFWGDHLRGGEEVGEIISIGVVLIGLALIATHNFRILGLCSVVSFLYSIFTFGILKYSSLQNHLFVAMVNCVILIWFIVLGRKVNREHPEEWMNNG